MRVVLLLWIAAGLAACDEGTSRLRGVSCATSYECTVGATFGTCQDNGYCAYPDATCADGSRYSPGAPDVGGQCVGGTCGASGEVCCAAETCSDGLACNSAGTCACGDEDGAPCCNGVCGANLTCNAGTCACGGPGEPCCGGSTCTIGTCNAGVCSAGWQHVAVGANFICGVRSDGTVACWGNSRFKYGRAHADQLVPVINSLVPVTIANATDVVAIEAGEGNACVRKADKTLWCWGHGSMGQLGNGHKQSSLAAVQVTGLSNVSKFSVGRQHVCAIGQVNGVQGLYCWGHNARGNQDATSTPTSSRLGNGATADSAVPVAVDMSQMAAAGQTVKDVAAGGYHTCAVMSDDRAWCWGYSTGENLGSIGAASTLVPILVDFSQITIPPGVTIEEIVTASGWSNVNPTLVRLSNGTVFGWGHNGHGQMGDATVTTRQRPETTVGGNHVFTQLDALNEAACGVDDANTVWCWGRGKAGQLGRGSTSSSTTPVQVVLPPGLTIEQLSTAHRTGCVLDSQHRLWCWGNNRRGTLTRVPADATNLDIATPVEVL